MTPIGLQRRPDPQTGKCCRLPGKEQYCRRHQGVGSQTALVNCSGPASGVLRERCGVAWVQQGEGLYGLRCALLLAGARAQLVSRWKVANAQTPALMVDYYQLLLKGEGRSEALREAQKTMIPTLQPYLLDRFRPHRQLDTSGAERLRSTRVKPGADGRCEIGRHCVRLSWNCLR
jgi:CHAT domain